MRALEITRAGIIGTTAVVVVAAVCVRLGVWQLDRRAERAARNEAVAERMAGPPVTLSGLPVDTAGLTYRRATVEGRLDSDRTIVLAGRSHAGRPGVHVYTPVRVGSGAVLVNRGWMPAADAATVDLSAIRRSGRVRYDGVLLPFPEPATHRPPPTDFRRTWFRLDGPGLRGQNPYAVAELYLLATRAGSDLDPGSDAGPEAGPDSDGDAGPGSDASRAGQLPVLLEPPALGAGPHLSYAIQWFSFAVIFVVGWVALLMKRGAG